MIEFTRPVWQVLNERQLRDLWYAQGQSLINLLDSVVGVGKWVTRSLPSGIRVDWKSPEAGHHDNWCVVRFRQEMPSGTPYCSLDVKLTEEYRRRGLSRATLESMARAAGVSRVKLACLEQGREVWPKLRPGGEVEKFADGGGFVYEYPVPVGVMEVD